MDCVVEAVGAPVDSCEPAPKFICLTPGWEFLESRQRNDFSQFGEDGLLEAVLERIGTTNQWCFEVGASDGVFYSNTKRLRDLGWYAVLIEGDPLSAGKCRQFESRRVQVHQEKVNPKSLDNILAGGGCPIRMDLGVIDVDGQDYWIWDGLKVFRPRVMLMEFMYLNDNFTDAAFVPELNGAGQAGMEAIVELGNRKGYVPLVATYCNLLFVDKSCL